MGQPFLSGDMASDTTMAGSKFAGVSFSERIITVTSSRHPINTANWPLSGFMGFPEIILTTMDDFGALTHDLNFSPELHKRWA